MSSLLGTLGPVTVRFDDAAADDAVDGLVRTADALVSMAGLLAQDAPIVTEDWTGRFRTTFDVESGRHVAAVMVLADSLRTTAVGIRAKQYEAHLAILAEAAEAEEGS